MKWPTFPLGRLAIELQPGFAQQPNEEGSGLPHLRTNNVSEDGTIDLSTIKRVSASREKREKYSLQPFDILFNNTNSPALVGKTALFVEEGDFLFSNHMTRVRVRRNVANPSYIARYLHWVWNTGGFRHMVTQWVSQAAINRNQLTRLAIPVPPLSEQRRIVEILDHADAIRMKRAESDAQAERILPALFYKMFGDPATNSLGWDIKSVADLSVLVTKGESPKWQGFGYVEKGIRFVTSENVLFGKIDLAKPKFIAEDFHQKLERSQLRTDDILFNIVGASIGRACIVRSEALPANINQAVAMVRLDTTKALPLFILTQILTPQIQQVILSSRVEAARANISLSDIRELKLLVPPIEKQERFVIRARSLFSSLEKQVTATEAVDILFNVLLHRAFAGDLTAKWREAHMKELLVEMEKQNELLGCYPVGKGVSEIKRANA